MRLMDAVYYRDRDGAQPVRDFVQTLQPLVARVVIENQIDRLNLCTEGGPPLPFPHSSQVEGDLRELRCHYGNRHYRVLYQRARKLFVLLSAFSKTTASIPQREIEIAKGRWNDFVARMGAKPRIRPRAAGHDAPGHTSKRA